jgi:hypothetical protein
MQSSVKNAEAQRLRIHCSVGAEAVRPDGTGGVRYIVPEGNIVPRNYFTVTVTENVCSGATSVSHGRW